jgi:hypothetical protein
MENSGSAEHSTGFVWWKHVQPVFALFTFLENTGSAGHSTGFCLVETGSTGFKTCSTGFCTVHFFLPVCCVSQKAVRSFLKTGSTGFWAEKSKRLVLEPHLYILIPTSLSHSRARLGLHS